MINTKFLTYPSIFLKMSRHKATIIQGKAIAEKVLNNLRQDVEQFQNQHNRVPHLTVLLVGENPASESYVKNKITAASVVGITTDTIRFDSNVPEQKVLSTIEDLNQNENIDGILLQLPLPSNFNTSICQRIVPEKDVDGFTATNFGKFSLHMKGLIPCTALAVQQLLYECGMNITGKNTVVVGRSKHVGLPIALLLHSNYEPSIGTGANVTICHRNTPHEKLVQFCRNADILISATGVPSLIRGHMIKKGAFVIDVGITRITDPTSSKTKLVGDVNFQEAVQIAGFITPVPGGVGPMTVAMLMKNTITAANYITTKKLARST